MSYSCSLQIVLCPKYNDGDELKRTLSDFKKLKNILSVAVVPVGITKYRKCTEDSKLYPVTKEIAEETIQIIDDFNTDIKKNIACCSDEFFALAEKPIPTKKYYGNFSQLEDGVGALRLLLDDFKKEKKRLPKSLSSQKNILFATSKLAKPAVEEIAKEINKIKNINVDIVAVNSTYWGEGISVAGLITSEDLINALKQAQDKNESKTNRKYDFVIMPSVTLRPFTEDFLDGKTLNDVKKSTGMNFVIIKDCYSTKEIVDSIINIA